MPRKKKKKQTLKAQVSKSWTAIFFLCGFSVGLSDRISLKLVSHKHAPRADPTGQKCSCRREGWFGVYIPPSKLPLTPALHSRVPAEQRGSGQVEIGTAGCSSLHLHPESPSPFLLVASPFSARVGQNNDFLGYLGKSTNSETEFLWGLHFLDL